MRPGGGLRRGLAVRIVEAQPGVDVVDRVLSGRADLVEIGYMNPGRWRHIAEVYGECGMLPRDFAFDGFLDDPAPKKC